MKPNYKSIWYKLATFCSNIVSSIHWNGLRALFNGGIYWDVTEPEHDQLREMLKPDYFFILTRRKTHLTTYLISITSWLLMLLNLIKTKKFKYIEPSYWTHALANLDPDDVKDDNDFRLIEATGTGFHYSTFMQVFDCDSVVLLQPKYITQEEWFLVMGGLRDQLGKDYDNFFCIEDSSKISCIEALYWSLKKLPDFETRFPHLIKLINENNFQLTPQMLYDCEDFKICYEIRH